MSFYHCLEHFNYVMNIKPCGTHVAPMPPSIQSQALSTAFTPLCSLRSVLSTTRKSLHVTSHQVLCVSLNLSGLADMRGDVPARIHEILIKPVYTYMQIEVAVEAAEDPFHCKKTFPHLAAACARNVASACGS